MDDPKRLAAFRVASTIGCTVEELGDRMTYNEFLGWCEYECWKEKRITKTDIYFARLLAMQDAHNNPGKRVYASEYIIGMEESLKAGYRDLRNASSDEVKQIFMSLPFVKYQGPKDG